MVIAIAGESGSGKTTLAQHSAGAFARPTSGEMYLYAARSCTHWTLRGPQDLWREVQAIFQDPFEVYNPYYKVDHVLTTPIAKFNLAPSGTATTAMIHEALRKVGLRAEETLGRFPHQLSGGQRQRIMIARALLLSPRIIIADEPVSMVDASLRATILESLLVLHREFGISILYITHDLTTAYQLCDSIIVLYRGMVAERGDVGLTIREPKHPYTQLLVDSIPKPNPELHWGSEALQVAKVEGSDVPDTGCKFAARCPHRMEICVSAHPPLLHTEPGHEVACYLYEEQEKGQQTARHSARLALARWRARRPPHHLPDLRSVHNNQQFLPNQKDGPHGDYPAQAPNCTA